MKTIECNSLEFTAGGIIPRCDECKELLTSHRVEIQDNANIKGEEFVLLKPMVEIKDQVVATFTMRVPIKIIRKTEWPKEYIEQYQDFLAEKGFNILGFDRQKGWSYHVFYFHCGLA